MATIDWNFWIGTTAGILATALFGLIPIILAMRHRYPGQLTYFSEMPIRLLDDITGNLTDLTVSFKGKPVQKNITLLKGFLVNTGSKDITKEMVERPLSFELAEGCRWLTASAKSQQDDVERAEIAGPKTVVLSLGLFRCNEFFRFEGLIEVTEGRSPGDIVLRDHRIADTGKVGWQSLPAKLSRKDHWKVVAFCCVLLLLGFGCLANLSRPVDKDTPIVVMLGVIFVAGGTLMAFLLTTTVRKNLKIRKILELDAG